MPIFLLSMIPKITGVFKNNPKLIPIILVLALFVSGYIKYNMMASEISNLQDELKLAESSGLVEANNNAQCRSDLSRLDNQLAAMNIEAKRIKQEIANAAILSLKAERKSVRETNKLLSEVVPTKCLEAVVWAKDKVKGILK